MAYDPETPATGSLRVLVVVPFYYPASYYGGMIVVAHKFAQQLAIRGHDVHVLTTNTAGPGRHLDVPIGRSIQFSPNHAVRYFHKVWMTAVSPTLLAGLLGEVRQADIVHLFATYSFPTIPTLIASRLARKPLVWSPQGALMRWGKTRKRFLKYIWERICHVVAPHDIRLHTATEVEAKAAHRRLPKFPVVVNPNGVDIPSAVERPAPPGVLKMLFIGRLDPIKGVDNLLRACHILLHNSYTNWHLTIAGAGDQRYVAELTRLCDALHLGGRVAFIGEIDAEKRTAVFRSVHLAVFPSHSESFGLVVVEALAHGVPTIVSTAAPWPQIEEVGCGLWVGNSPQSLADSILAMRDKPLSEMGERGRSWVIREYSWQAVGTRLEKIYIDLLDSWKRRLEMRA